MLQMFYIIVYDNSYDTVMSMVKVGFDSRQSPLKRTVGGAQRRGLGRVVPFPVGRGFKMFS